MKTKVCFVALAVALAWSSLAFCDEIHDAARSGDLAKVESLLAGDPNLVFSKDSDGATPLHLAADKGYKTVVELLLAKGAEVNATYGMSQTALHRAAIRGHEDVVELLLAKGADVNAKDSDGGTPLHFAAQFGHADVVELLLAKGADVNAKDNIGDTPLLEAGQYAIAELLLAKGADVNARNNDGWTALRQAEAAGLTDVTALLREYIDKSATTDTRTAVNQTSTTPSLINTEPRQPLASAEAAPTPQANVSADDYFTSGNAKKANGDLNGALVDYDKAIELKPDYANAYYNRGTVKKAKGDMEGALADFNKAIELKPNFGDALVDRDDLMKANGVSSPSTTAVQPRYQPEATPIPRANVSADDYDNSGNAKKANGDLAGAILDYTRAIELKPDYAGAYYDRGSAKQANGDMEGATADYNKAKSIWAGVQILPANENSTITQSAQPAEATPTSAAVPETSSHPAPDQSPQLREVVKLTQAKMSDDVILSFIKSSGTSYNLSEDDIVYLSSHGVSQPVISALLTAHPSATVAASEQQSNPASANPYNGQPEIAPGSAEAWRKKGVTFFKSGQYSEALRYFDKALEIDPQFAHALYAKAVTEDTLRHPSEAILNYRKFLTLAPPEDANMIAAARDRLSKLGWHDYQYRYQYRSR